MNSSEVIAAIMEKVNEGLAGISADQMTVVVALIAVVVIYAGLIIILDLLYSASQRDSEGEKK